MCVSLVYPRLGFVMNWWPVHGGICSSRPPLTVNRVRCLSKIGEWRFYCNKDVGFCLALFWQLHRSCKKLILFPLEVQNETVSLPGFFITDNGKSHLSVQGEENKGVSAWAPWTVLCINSDIVVCRPVSLLLHHYHTTHMHSSGVGLTQKG